MVKSKLTIRRCKNPSCNMRFQQVQALQYVCCWKCGVEYTNLLRTNKAAKESREKTKVMKDGLMTLSDYKKILQSHINHIVRLIDAGQPCIATGATTGKRNAGHYFSVGSNETLRFHLDNIHIQSEHSNSWKGGDTLNYQAGIERIYGIEYLNHLNSLKSINPIKLSISELKEKIVIALSIVKQLKHQDSEYNVYSRVLLRTSFNNQLGIYKYYL